MKRVRLIGAGVLLLLLGAVAPTYARQDQQDNKPPKQEQKAKPAKQERQQQAKPEKQQQQQQRQQQAKTQQNEQRQQQAKTQQNEQRQQQAKTQQNEQRQQQAYRPSRQEQGQQQVAWQDHRARDWQSEHRNWQQRGGYNGYRIPDNSYRGYFGQDHSFRIYGLPEMVVGGYPRFQYEGFWFSVVDPWPEAWSNNWYDNDDVYVVYSDGGYYLYDNSHPGIGLALSVYQD